MAEKFDPDAYLAKGFDPDAYLKGESQPSVTADIAKEGGKGLLRGAAGFVGDIAEAPTGLFRHVPQLIADIRGEPPKPREPTYGERISKAAGIEASPQTTAGKFAGTTGEVLGNPLTYLGPGSIALKLGAGAASGLASEAAGQLSKAAAPDAPGLETAARFVGGLAGGAGPTTVAAERNLSKLAAQLPTHENIYNAAKAGYKMLEQSNLRINPQGMDELTRQIKADLHASGARPGFDQPGASIFKTVEELATSGGSIQDIDAVRKVLGRYKPDPAKAFAADVAIDAIDDFLINVDPRYVVSGNPANDAAILKHAQGNWAAHKQLEMIEASSIKGQHRAGVAGTGANRINTARQEIRKILDSDKKSRGMSQAAKDKMEEIVMGTWLTNKSRYVGKYAPSSPISASSTILATIGGGPVAGAAVAGGGFLAKYFGEYLTDRQISQLEQIIRSESPIGRPIARAIAPAVAQQQLLPTAAAAATRSALTTPLSPGGDERLYVSPLR